MRRRHATFGRGFPWRRWLALSFNIGVWALLVSGVLRLTGLIR